MLKEHSTVFWIDSSVRFFTSNLTSALRQAVDNGGILTFNYAGHSIRSGTHDVMFEYLPMDKTASAEVMMIEGGVVYIHRSKQV